MTEFLDNNANSSKVQENKKLWLQPQITVMKAIDTQGLKITPGAEQTLTAGEAGGPKFANPS